MAPIPSNPMSCDNLGLQVKLAATKVKKGLVLDDIPTQDDLTALIRSVASKQDDPAPFYVLDLGVVVRLMDKWTRSFPNVTPFYAVKCNNDPALLASLATLGAGFDCASKAEIEAVLSHGVSPSRIVYANPCKGDHHLKYAAGVQVNLATFDSLHEIGKIRQCHPNCSLLIRIAVPNDSQSSWRAFGTKFGVLPEEVSQLLRHAHKSGLKVVGVSFHVGSKVSEPKVYLGALAAARAAFNAAEELKMPKMHVLDIGGGFKANSLFDEIVETVNEGIKEYFSKEYSDLVVIAEPGRFFAETSFTMAANVIGKRVRGERREYWISDGIYGSFNLPAYDRSSMKVSPLLRKGDVDGDEDSDGAVVLCSSTLFGPTCDSLDTAVADLELPELEVNDFLVFHDMGAYTSSAATNFNGFYMAETPTYLAFTGAD